MDFYTPRQELLTTLGPLWLYMALICPGLKFRALTPLSLTSFSRLGYSHIYCSYNSICSHVFVPNSCFEEPLLTRPPNFPTSSFMYSSRILQLGAICSSLTELSITCRFSPRYTIFGFKILNDHIWLSTIPQQRRGCTFIYILSHLKSNRPVYLSESFHISLYQGFRSSQAHY